jgi:hypothetical protein
VVSEILDRGVDEPVLLALIDRRGAVAKITAAAQTDFDKYELVTMGHHEISHRVVFGGCDET